MQTSIKNRHVFFLSAFDPRGVRAYASLYKKESMKQGRHNNLHLSIGSRFEYAPHVSRWQIKAFDRTTFKNLDDIPHTTTHYDFLHWDDIIRSNWIRKPIPLLREGIKCNFHYGIKSTTFGRILKLAPNAAISGAIPFIFGMLSILVTFLFFKIIFTGGFISFVFAAFLSGGALFGSLKIAQKFNLFWILRGHIFFSKLAKSGHKELDERMTLFAKHIAKTLQKSDADEILLIAHCMGINIAVHILDHLITNEKDIDISRLKFVALGQVLPWYSFLPETNYFRKKLKTLAQTPTLNWTDISAPPDTVCFALIDPFLQTNATPTLNFKSVSPRFHTMFSNQKYKTFKHNRLRMHFQYLMSSDKKTAYDYFEMTAGQSPLETMIKNITNDKRAKKSMDTPA